MIAPLITSRVIAPLITSRVIAPLITSRVIAPLITSRVIAPLITYRVIALRYVDSVHRCALLRAVPDTALLALYTSIAHEPLRISERISKRISVRVQTTIRDQAGTEIRSEIRSETIRDQEGSEQEDGAKNLVYSSVRPQGASLGDTSLGADHGGAADAASGAAYAAVPAASAESAATEALAHLTAALTQIGTGASSGDVGILSDGSSHSAALARAHVRLVDRTIDWQVAYYNLLDGARHLRHAVARVLVPARLARNAPATAL